MTIAACGGGPAKESTGEYIDDSTITTKVKAAFVSDKAVDAMDVKVETFKGTVQLSGFADSSAEIERATQIAAKVAGVKAVRNDIRLKPGK
jgi:osmotically-inducible protein OsmY